jgi:5-methylcytosine-specific restriction protein B
MESEGRLCLHSGTKNLNNGTVPPAIQLPSNLFIIGTVNIDETTYMFSPKVLDRAAVIEFSISKDEMEMFLNNDAIAQLNNLTYKGAEMSESFVKLAIEKKSSNTPKEIKEEILKFFTVLKQAGAEFGFRTATEIMLFTTKAPQIGPWDNNDLMDAIIMQKLLPKVHGGERKLEPILKTLAGFCLNDSKDVDKYIKANGQLPNVDKDEAVKYKISLNKIQRMYTCLITNGSTGYAQA